MAANEQVVKVASNLEQLPRSEQTEFQKAVGQLIDGCELIKIKGSRRKFRRTFHLHPDWDSISYESAILPCYYPLRTIDLHDIREIRTGYNSDSFNAREKSAKFCQKYPEERCFSIVLRNGKILDLVAGDPGIRDSWTAVLRQLVDRGRQANREAKLRRWLERQFSVTDVTKDGVLEFDEILQLLARLNCKVSRHQALQLFGAAAPKNLGNGKGALDKDGFSRLFRLLSKRPEMTALFDKYVDNKDGDYWTPEVLQHFLHVEQKQDVSLEGCRAAIQTFEQLDEYKERGQLSILGLTSFLMNIDQHAFNPSHGVVYQNMTHPLTDYFIASLHNSYLMDHQLAGASSIEGYISCLLSGCRCLELDCWDGPDGEPIITHGYTLTTDIFFHDVVQVIADYGFKASDYPVILSLENHCSLEQQDRMAFHIKNILKDQLFVGPIKTSDKAFPSPDTLKFKVLVKAKKLPEDVHHDAEVDNGTDEETQPVPPDQIDGNVISKKHEKVKVSKALSDCVYLKAVKFDGLISDHKGKFFEMSSISETKIMAMLSERRNEIITHSRLQLVRIYPAGTRINSTNFDAIPLFDSGCQLIAINYQNHNKPTQAYRAKFRDNGSCGYLLKPEFMRIPEVDVAMLEAKRRPWLLKIRVISAQQLPKPVGAAIKDIIDPYVTIAVVGRDYDVAKKRTGVIKNNGFNPVWDQTLEFRIHNPEMTVVRFKVKDEEMTSANRVIGHYNVAMTCFQQGYRHIELYDLEDQKLEFATLFLHVSLEEIP